MDVPIEAEVYCENKVCGYTMQVILNPVTDVITHVVIRNLALPHKEYLVPVELIIESTPDKIVLRCSMGDLGKMEPFVKNEFIMPEEIVPQHVLHYDPYSPPIMWPYVELSPEAARVKHENVPAGEISLKRGTEVFATDGKIGVVDEFLIEPTKDRITHLILLEGHLWGKKEVTIPINKIDHISGKKIYLKMNKQDIESLPTIPVNRRWSRK